MKRVLDTAPTAEAVDPKDFRMRARITQSRDNELIEELLDEAQEDAEAYLGRKLITQTWVAYYDYFPDFFRLPYPPVQSVTSVKYLDDDGDTQEVSTDTWELGKLQGEDVVRTEYDEQWPTDVRDHEDAIWIEYVTGYGTTGASVPNRIKAAIRLHAAHRYRHREDEPIPPAFYNYLRSLRVKRFATLGQT